MLLVLVLGILLELLPHTLAHVVQLVNHDLWQIHLEVLAHGWDALLHPLLHKGLGLRWTVGVPLWIRHGLEVLEDSKSCLMRIRVVVLDGPGLREGGTLRELLPPSLRLSDFRGRPLVASVCIAVDLDYLHLQAEVDLRLAALEKEPLGVWALARHLLLVIIGFSVEELPENTREGVDLLLGEVHFEVV